MIEIARYFIHYEDLDVRKVVGVQSFRDKKIDPSQ